MFFVSEPFVTPPERFGNALQAKTYRALGELRIPYERVETDEAITMEDCALIDRRLGMKMVKTLFLCNRQQTAFDLFVTAGDKPFRSKEFSAALGIARVSFAPAETMERMLGTKVGAATVFGVLTDSAGAVRVVMDREVRGEKWFGCSDGTTTGYLKLATEDVERVLLPWAKHPAAII